MLELIKNICLPRPSYFRNRPIQGLGTQRSASVKYLLTDHHHANDVNGLDRVDDIYLILRLGGGSVYYPLRLHRCYPTQFVGTDLN